MRAINIFRLLAATVAIGACAPNYPPTVWEGEHLEFATDRDRLLCEGTFAVQDRFVAALADELGAELVEPVRFVYVEKDEVNDYCGHAKNLGGCALEDAVISIFANSQHELTHAVAATAGWGGPAPFQEGVAEVFGNGYVLSDSRLPLADVLEDFELSFPHYNTAALWVRFLIERHGFDALAAFMRATSRSDVRQEYAPVFEEHFGEPLDDAVTAFDDYPTCTPWNNRIALLECALPPTPWEGERLEMMVDMACENEDVVGPLEEDPMSIGATRAFELESAATIDVTVTADFSDFGGVRITRCGSCWDVADHQVEAGETETLTLDPGRYFATFVKHAYEPGILAATLERQP